MPKTTLPQAHPWFADRQRQPRDHLRRRGQGGGRGAAGASKTRLAGARQSPGGRPPKDWRRGEGPWGVGVAPRNMSFCLFFFRGWLICRRHLVHLFSCRPRASLVIALFVLLGVRVHMKTDPGSTKSMFPGSSWARRCHSRPFFGSCPCFTSMAILQITSQE